MSTKRARGEEPRLGALFLVLFVGTVYLAYEAKQAITARNKS